VGRAGRIAAGLAGAIVLVLVLAQLFLPGLAANRISSRVGRYGSVESVTVKAWPAIELLWGHADSVTVRAQNLEVSPAQTGKLLREARGVEKIELTASSAQEGPLRLSNVSFHKQGAALSAQAQISVADVKAALPEGFDVQLLSSSGGEVEVRATGGLFGVGASVDAVAHASGGRLVASPRGFLVGGLQLTVFSEPDVYVEAVGASAISGSAGVVVGYRLTIRASLR
jgi:LmeA-like phospholipid-binding